MTNLLDEHMPKYGIRVAAALTGTPMHTLRLWEELGLVQPARTEGKVRLYSDADIRLVREIAELAARGINAAGIREILAMRRSQARPPEPAPDPGTPGPAARVE